MAVKTRNYDLTAAVTGLILSAVAVILHFLKMPNEYLISLGSFMIISCLFYLLFRKKLLDSNDNINRSGDSLNRTLLINIIFMIALAASLYALQNDTPYRPLSYFILTAVTCAVIAVEIILYSGSKGQIYSILAKIFIIAFSLRGSQYFGFAGIAGVDPWTHYEIIRDLLAQGHVPQFVSVSGQANTYFNYPIFHLFTGIMSNITGSSIKDAMFLAIALPEVLSIVFLFLLGRKLIGVQGGLLAALVMAFSDFHIQWGTQVIAMTLGITLVSLFIYMVMTRETWGRSSVIRFMTILLFAAVVLTHTVTAFVLLICISILFITPWVYRMMYRTDTRFEYISLTFMSLSIVGILTQWIYAAFQSSNFFEAVLKGLRDSLVSKADFLDRPEVIDPQNYSLLNDSILNISGFTILFGFGVIGGLLYLSKRYHDVNRVSLITLAAVLFTIPFGFSLFGIRNVMPYRWFVFMYIPLVITASFAIVKIIGMYKRTPFGILTVAIIIAVFSFLMITSTISNNDNPLYKEETTTRLAYTTQEMNSASILSRYYDDLIVVDGYYSLPFRYFHYGAPVSRLSEFWIEDRLPDGVFVWRENMGQDTILASGENTRDAWIRLDKDYEQQVSTERHLVYSNPQVKAYLSK